MYTSTYFFLSLLSQQQAAPESAQHSMLHETCHTASSQCHTRITSGDFLSHLSLSLDFRLQPRVVCRNSAFVELLYDVENDDDDNEFILPFLVPHLTKQGENIVE